MNSSTFSTDQAPAARVAFLCLFLAILVVFPAPASAQNFIRGDANGDGDTNFYVGDVVALTENLLAGCATVACEDGADANDDGVLNLLDVIDNLNNGITSSLLPAPFPACGPDPTPDPLGCAAPCISFPGYTLNPGFLLEISPVGSGSGLVGSIVTVEVKLTVPPTEEVTGISFGFSHDPAELQMVSGSVAPGPLVPDFFIFQTHPTGVNLNIIPSLIGAFGYTPGVHVVAVVQYEVLTPGVHALTFGNMTGIMPVPVALCSRSSSTGGCSVVSAPVKAGSTVTGLLQEFIRGDTNADGICNVADVINLLQCLFIGSGSCPCDDASDINDDGAVNIGDIVFKLSFLFIGGPPPPAPYPGCGTDPTTDPLGCASFPPCP